MCKSVGLLSAVASVLTTQNRPLSDSSVYFLRLLMSVTHESTTSCVLLLFTNIINYSKNGYIFTNLSRAMFYSN